MKQKFSLRQAWKDITLCTGTSLMVRYYALVCVVGAMFILREFYPGVIANAELNHMVLQWGIWLFSILAVSHLVLILKEIGTWYGK